MPGRCRSNPANANHNGSVNSAATLQPTLCSCQAEITTISASVIAMASELMRCGSSARRDSKSVAIALRTAQQHSKFGNPLAEQLRQDFFIL